MSEKRHEDLTDAEHDEWERDITKQMNARLNETALQRLLREVGDAGELSGPEVTARIVAAVEYEQQTKERMRGLRITMMRNEVRAWERAHQPTIADGTVGMRRGE